MGKKSEKRKMILDNLYRCRDIEINNLWQKGIFLGPFLALCFTGYGVLLFSMIKECKEEVLFKYNLLCFAICFVSVIFSILWIYMFKGSKIHYEIYERAITDFEKNQLQLEEKYVMGKLSKDNIQIDKNPLTMVGGCFSPSKINIAIGQLCLFLWIISMICHLGYIVNYIFCVNSIFLSILVIILLIFVVVFLIHLYRGIQSTSIEKK